LAEFRDRVQHGVYSLFWFGIFLVGISLFLIVVLDCFVLEGLIDALFLFEMVLEQLYVVSVLLD
jgi:hypothetical protein